MLFRVIGHNLYYLSLGHFSGCYRSGQMKDFYGPVSIPSYYVLVAHY